MAESALHSTITIHATSVAIEGYGLLLSGDPGIGKSALALKLLADGYQLISDDATQLMLTERGNSQQHNQLLASALPATQGKLIIRGFGHIDLIKQFDQPVVLEPTSVIGCIELTNDLPNTQLEPKYDAISYLGVTLPRVVINAALILQLPALVKASYLLLKKQECNVC